MSFEDDRQSLLQVSQNQQVPAHQLSGDENAERSILLSDIRVQKSNFFLTVMTIMKTVIGVGILGLPYTVARLGWLLALIMFTVTSLLTQYGCVLLLKVKNLSHHSNYSTIGCTVVRSRYFQALIYFIVLFNNLGVCIAELTIFKESIIYIYREFNKDVEDPWYIQAWFTVAICLGVCLIPLIVVQKIQKLRFLALLGISAISAFVVMVVYNFFKESSDRGWDFSGLNLTAFPPSDEPFEAIAAIPNILLAFLYQMNFFPIYKGMKNSSDKKMTNASWVGCIACYFIYGCVAFLGYLTYGSAINDSNFLRFLNKDQIGSALYLIMNIVFISSVLCSFPIIFFGARNNFIALIKIIKSATTNEQKHIRNSRFARSGIEEISDYIKEANMQKKKRLVKITFYALTFILYAAIVTLAVTIGKLGTIFNLVGAIASNSIGFIFPTLFYILLIRRKRRPKRINYYLAILLFLTAVPFGIFAVVAQALI